MKNHALVQRALAFIITIGVVWIFMPSDSGFSFDYSLHNPWKYDRLIAPFDFGIYKTEQDLEAEFEMLKSEHPPVFSITPELDEKAVVQVHDAWENATVDSISPCSVAAQLSVDALRGWLDAGIVQQSEATKGLTARDSVLLESGGVVKSVPFSRTLNLSAVTDSVRQLALQLEDSICGRALDSILMAQLYSNAIYNDSLTNKLLTAEFDKLVRVQGKVNKGEAIIDKGEMVDKERYRVLESLRTEVEKRDPSNLGFSWSTVGTLAVVALVIGLMMLFVFANEPRLFNDPRPITLSLSLLSVCFAASALALSSEEVSIYVIPIGITPLLLRMFFDFRVSLFSLLGLVLVVSLFANNSLEYIFIQFLAGSFATLYQTASTRRSRILNTAVLVFLGYSLSYLAFSLAQQGSLDDINTANFGWFAINALLCTMVFPLIYVVEKVFGFISETTLLELSDSNQPLLKELATASHIISIACSFVPGRGPE